jgi:excisionase family DNA binding protein
MDFSGYWREDRILRVHTAAKILGCSTRTIRRRILNHEIPATRMNRRAWGIRACDLERRRGNGGGGYAGN